MTLFGRWFRRAQPDVVAPAVRPAQPRIPEPTAPAVQTAAAAADEEARTAALIDAGTLDPAEFVLKGLSSRLRQRAAHRVEDPVQLRELMRQVRSKDKGVYKILKQKCDALDAEERRRTERADASNAVCAALERHAQRTHDSAYEAVFARVSAEWHAVRHAVRQAPGAPVDADLARRAARAIERCDEIIAAHRDQLARQAADDVERQAADERSREAAAHARREAESAAAVLAQAETEQRAAADGMREAHEREAAEKRAADERVFRQISGLIRRADEALTAGMTQQAAGLRRAIDERSPGAVSLPAHLSRQLQRLDARLDELRQWKEYAVAPKRLELIEEMESLIGSTQEPRALADRIKWLQQEWRTNSKGVAGDVTGEWERFNRAAQAAYEPCGQYFEAQASARQENLRSRTAVLERLTSFESTLAEDAADWRLMENVLREAPREWRRCGPVDRQALRPLQEAFDAAIGRLRARLVAVFTRNEAERRLLIEQARQLRGQADSRETIDAMKRLQLLWKAAGAVPRDLDQSLWSEFREQCDAVFEKRQHAHAQYTAGLEVNRRSAELLCEQMERVAELSETGPLESDARIAELRAAFEALDEMPRADAREIQARFGRAIERCHTQTVRHRERAAQRSCASLIEAGRHVRHYEWAVISHLDAAERDASKAAAEAFIEAVPQWPKGGLQVVNERLASGGSASADDLAAREMALRTVCIRCEIQADTSTPTEDQPLRRAYQVQRLVRGMGRGERPEDADPDAMLLEWSRIGAVAPALHAQLEQRFLECRTAWLAAMRDR